MVIEDSAITIRVRMFRDDLEHALARFHGTDSATIARHPRLDSLVAPYLAKTLVLTVPGGSAGGRLTLEGPVVQVGRERDEGNWEMTWVLLRLPLAAPVQHLEVRNDIMFELFPNQQNLVQVLVLPGGARQALYFAPGSGPQSLEVSRPSPH